MPKNWEAIASGLQKEVDRLRKQNRELKAKIEIHENHMVNRSKNRGHRPSKNGKATTIRLRDSDRALANAIAPNMTAGIESGLKLVEFAIDKAAMGDKDAIALLKKIGVEVIVNGIEPITVRRADGSIAAWIVNSPTILTNY